DFGVTGVVESTALEVYTSGNTTTPLLENSGWTSASGDGRELGAFALPAGSADSVVRADFAADGYTAQVLPHDNTTAPGAALVEIYDAAIEDLAARLINLSARTALSINGDVTVGFVLAGNTPRTVLIRAVGPGLATFGVAGTLADPQLT